MTTHVGLFSELRGRPTLPPPEQQEPPRESNPDPLSGALQRLGTGATPATAAPPPVIQGGDWTVFDLLSGGVYDEEKRPDPGQYYVTDEQAKTGALDEFHDDVPLPWLGIVSAIFRDGEEQADVTRKSLEIMGVPTDLVSFGNDQNGHFMNLKLKSGNSVKKYFNQKGLSKADVTGFAGDLAMFAPGAGWAARGATTVGKLILRNALAEGSTEALRQGIEKLMGGEFNAGDVAGASAGGAIGAGIAGVPFAIIEKRLDDAIKGKTKAKWNKVVSEDWKPYGGMRDTKVRSLWGRRAYLNKEYLQDIKNNLDEIGSTKNSPGVDEMLDPANSGRVPGGILPQVRGEIQELSRKLLTSRSASEWHVANQAQRGLMAATLNRIFKGAGTQTSESQLRQAKVFMANLHKPVKSPSGEDTPPLERDVRRGMTALYNSYKRPSKENLLSLSRVMEVRTFNNYLKWASGPSDKDNNLIEHSLYDYYQKVASQAEQVLLGRARLVNKTMSQTVLDDLAYAQQQFLSRHLDPSIVTATMSKLDAAEMIANNIDKIFSGKGQNIDDLMVNRGILKMADSSDLEADALPFSARRESDSHPDLQESFNVLFGEPFGFGDRFLEADGGLRELGRQARKVARKLRKSPDKKNKRASKELDSILHRLGVKVNLIKQKKAGTSLNEIVPQALDAVAPLAPGGGALARWARGRVKRYGGDESDQAGTFRDLSPRTKAGAELNLDVLPAAGAAFYDPQARPEAIEQMGDDVGKFIPPLRFRGGPGNATQSQSYRLLSKRFPHLEAAGLL